MRLFLKKGVEGFAQSVWAAITGQDLGIGATGNGDKYLADDMTWKALANPSQAWPVGSVFLAVVSTNPATLLGYGTWSRIAEGRALVGVNEGDSDFDTPEKTGGAKTHTLTSAEMPSHTHAVTDPGHIHRQRRLAGAGSTGHVQGGASDSTQTSATDTESATTGITIGNTGGGGAHNNLQPYLTVYIWKRTA